MGNAAGPRYGVDLARGEDPGVCGIRAIRVVGAEIDNRLGNRHGEDMDREEDEGEYGFGEIHLCWPATSDFGSGEPRMVGILEAL